MRIINLQRHPVTVIPNDNARPVTFPSEGMVQVRMKVQDMTDNGVVKDGFWVYTRDLPDPAPDTLYIVSSLVAMFELYQNNRTDLLFPWGLIKDSHGRVHGCRALCRPRKKGL